ncbi:hypothetical protein ASPCAL08682 [Aspergillus calidoustus]|uniref:Uncharacterized protein n=1 Tax=Aspergillus calidoustus TaxID=454130 RepID=A0A0U5HKE4_ASPCI|nr:hypothetical protein ASPCAL08682 [Aspergillus calidoustus]
MDVHVVSKLDNRQHATMQVTAPTDPLKPSSIRVRTTLIGLTSNNLTYAMGGSFLGWWDAYPLLACCDAPYDNQTWGIVPAWGFATVLETTISEIPAGTTVYGLWPTSACPVDLELVPTVPAGHWQEVSPHRQKLASFYNRYTVIDLTSQSLENFAWDAVVYPTWGAGYILSEYVFSPDPATRPGIHPLGAAGGDWSFEDADLRKTIFINLAASTKTARGTAYNLFQRPARSGPLGLLQITSSPGPLSEAARNMAPPFPTKTVLYEDIPKSAEWIASIEPTLERIVIADFGGRDGALDTLVKTIQESTELRSLKLTIIAVGNQQKIYTIPEIMAMQASHASIKVQMNTSGVQDCALQIPEPKAYFDELHQRWTQWLDNRRAAAPDLRLVWGDGIAGTSGVEGGWDALCQGKVKPEEALVYRV